MQENTPNIPESDLILLMRGERPEGMDFQMFKAMRKSVQLMNVIKLKGKFIPNKK